MWTATFILIAAATLLACASLGGGLYETAVVDPAWPARPAIISPRQGGIDRKRFWLPAHTAFEVALIVAVILSWGEATVRTALLIALGAHAVMRVWSLLDFVPKALAFEKADDVDEAAARKWTRRSRWRLPLDLVTCVAMLAALASFG